MTDRTQTAKKRIFKSASAGLALMVLVTGTFWEMPNRAEGGDRDAAAPSRPADQEDIITEVIERFEAGAYREVIDLIDRQVEKHPLTDPGIFLVSLKATAHLELNETDQAIAAYESTLPVIRKRHNVGQRRFASIFFTLGALYHETGNEKKAISLLEEGLTLKPQNIPVQILLGEYYAEAGKRDQATSHYRELLDGPGLKEEEGVVIRTKLRRLGAAAAEVPFPYQELARQPFHKGFTIRILPINGHDPSIQIEDICPLLESKFLVRCELLEPMAFDEKSILDPARNQYDGSRIIDLLKRQDPNPKSRNSLLIAFTGKDIFGTKTNFVFSWQNRSLGIGVLSSRRFSEVEKSYEPEMIATRRVAIQFISTVANLLGFSRTTKPHCPTSYPNDLDDFRLKSAKLCEQTVVERDDFLNTIGSRPGRFEPAQLRDIERVYNKYSFR